MYTVIEDNKEFLLISKDPGVDFHRGTADTGLTGRIRDDLKISELYPLHRLDTMTSGLLLFAKTNVVAKELTAQFRNHSIDKFYIALAGVNPKKKQGMIIGDMSKSRNGSWLLSRTVNNPAITQFFSSGMGNGLRLYIVKIHTGKTHQIRVALKSLGVPILGDSLYNKKKDNDFIPDRGYLHAFAIRFKLGNKEYRFLDFPSKGVHFLTDNFNNSFVKYKNPWLLQWRTKIPVRCDMLKG